MKSKIKMPLVIFSLLMVLGICSATVYYFNTRETNKLNDTVEKETAKSNVSEENDEEQNVVSTDVELPDEIKHNEEQKENSKSDNLKEDNSNNNNNSIKTDTSKKDNSSSNNNTTSKVEQNNQSSSNDSSTQQTNSSDNNEVKEEQKTDENKQSESTNSNDSKQEEQNNSNIYDIPDEDNKDNVSSFENDEEYIKLKATIEFETRAECQAAADIIGPQYALQGNLRNTSCKSFAYKGTVVGYRLQIFFTDGTWIYNN